MRQNHDKKKDALLEKISQSNRESTVFFLAAEVSGVLVGSNADHPEAAPEVPMFARTSTAFYVEPDKIVTTIEALAGTFAVAGISADHFTKIVKHKSILPFGRADQPQSIGKPDINIEGVTAFDTQNNLVLLKVTELGVPLPLANSDTLEIGETVYTLGYQDIGKYVDLSGPIQGRYRNDRWLQIQTDFSAGVGGGPVLNSQSAVVGVIAFSSISTHESTRVNIATAISSNVLTELLANSGEIMSLQQLQKNPRVRAYVLEAQADQKSERQDNGSAIRDYNAALKLNPHLVEIYAKRGIVKGCIGNIRGALKDFDRMIRINPSHVFAYNNRAFVKRELGDQNGAIEDFNKAIAVNPEYTIPYINLGSAKLDIASSKIKTGDILEAQRYCQEGIDNFNRVLALNPKDSVAREQLKQAERIRILLKLHPKAE